LGTTFDEFGASAGAPSVTGGWLISAGPGNTVPLTPHDEQPLGAAAYVVVMPLLHDEQPP
jgi:hypothetical protein